MYSIGQFSIMFQINKKTLRYYDEIGLFKPAYVDESNQYRYYKEEQIEVMKEIIRWKNVGISLEQIAALLNHQNLELLHQCYEKRLMEIEEEKRALDRQKNMILEYQQNKQKSEEQKSSISIDKGNYILEGNVYYKVVNCEMEEIHQNIGLFYEEAKGMTLNGSHIFKMNMDEDNDGVAEIFAYTPEKTGEKIRHQKEEFCLKVECPSMRQKTDGYHAIFDYAQKHNNRIKNIYEQYHMEAGALRLTIMVAIDTL